jgi:hypothetical protein
MRAPWNGSSAHKVTRENEPGGPHPSLRACPLPEGEGSEVLLLFDRGGPGAKRKVGDQPRDSEAESMTKRYFTSLFSIRS